MSAIGFNYKEYFVSIKEYLYRVLNGHFLQYVIMK